MENRRSNIEHRTSRKALSPFLLVSLSPCLLVFLSACHRPPAPIETSPVMLVINQEPITRAAFDAFVLVRAGGLREEALSAKVHSQLLDEFITRQVTIQETRRRGTPASENTTKMTLPADSGATEVSIPPALREQERQADSLAKAFQQQAAMGTQPPTREEVTRYYEEHKDQYQRTGFYLREIRVQSQPVIEELARKLATDRTAFIELARKYSQGSNARQGGLNYYDRGQLPAEIEEQVLALRPGEISRVLHTSFGFHIFKMERQAEALSFDSVREEIMDEITEARQQERIEQETSRLLAGAKIEIREAVLGFAYVGSLRP